MDKAQAWVRCLIVVPSFRLRPPQSGISTTPLPPIQVAPRLQLTGLKFTCTPASNIDITVPSKNPKDQKRANGVYDLDRGQIYLLSSFLDFNDCEFIYGLGRFHTSSKIDLLCDRHGIASVWVIHSLSDEEYVDLSFDQSSLGTSSGYGTTILYIVHKDYLKVSHCQSTRSFSQEVLAFFVPYPVSSALHDVKLLIGLLDSSGTAPTRSSKQKIRETPIGSVTVLSMCVGSVPSSRSSH